MNKQNQNLLTEIIEDNAFLVDVRTPKEYKMGHVEGSINIPLATIPKRLDEFKNKKNIVVFCQSGGRSEQAKMYLQQIGLDCVTNGGCWEDVHHICCEIDKNNKT